jgi:20S proteasome subunit alpha 7
MTSIGTGYDLDTTSFSPIGRLFQIEYAHKAVDSSGTVIGLRCSDGVILACEKIVSSKLLVEGLANRRIQQVDNHIGFLAAGWLPDGRHVSAKAQTECKNYKSFYDDPIPLSILAERISNTVQMHTIYSWKRVIGCTALIAGVDRKGPQLYMIEPSGLSFGYFGCAAGKAAGSARSLIEKLDLKNMKCKDAVVEAAKIIYEIHDDIKDKLFELEMSWICTESGNKHQFVPKDLVDAAEKIAKEEEK